VDCWWRTPLFGYVSMALAATPSVITTQSKVTDDEIEHKHAAISGCRNVGRIDKISLFHDKVS
jgi:hypothetical protein